MSTITEDHFIDLASKLQSVELLTFIELINTASLLHHAHCSENEILDALRQILVPGIQEPPLRVDVVRRRNLRKRNYQKIA